MSSKSRCYPCVAPVLVPVLPRCRHVQAGVPCFTTVKPGSVPVHTDDCLSRQLCLGIENVSNRGGPGRHRGESGRHWNEPGRHRGKLGLTVAKFLKPVCPGCVPVHHGGVLVHPSAGPIISPVPSRLPTVCAIRQAIFLCIRPIGDRLENSSLHWGKER